MAEDPQTTAGPAGPSGTPHPAAGKTVDAPVAPGVTPKPSASLPADAAAKTLAPLFGGLRGGRKREDGLVPGSPEAIEADREKDRLRAKRKRELEAATRPTDALPSMAPSNANPDAAAPLPMGSGVAAAGAPFVPWVAEQLAPMIAEMIGAVEDRRVEKFFNKAKEARLTEKSCREISNDAKFPPAAKKGLCVATPKVAAKWLNKSGISAEYADEVMLVGCFVAIVSQGRTLGQKLDKLVESAKSTPPPLPGKP